MKLIVYILAAVGALVVGGLMLGGKDQRAGLAGLCPQIPQGSITLPDSHAADLALLLNAADALNNSGTCVRDGGWSASSGAFYFTIQEPGARHQVRHYSGAELRSLASLGQRPP
jgi:hypothetical protein